MKSFKTALASVAVAATVAFSGSAHAVLTNWYFDANGAGDGFNGVQVGQYLDLNGQAFVVNTFAAPPVNGTAFTFQEAGTFITNLADSTTALNAPVTSTFTGTGSGTVGGTLTFNTDGVLQVGVGGSIAVFDLVFGSANLNGGTVLPNGVVSLVFRAQSIAAGYFFDSAMNDLSLLNPIDVLIGFVTTNAIPIGTGSGLTTGAPPGGTALQNLYNATFDPDVADPTIDQLTYLRLSNNGQFQLQIPEPGTLALLGIGLFGFGVTRRRVSK